MFIEIRPSEIRCRKFDYEKWGRKKSVRRFLWYLSRSDGAGLDSATNALIRLDCLGEALKECMKGPTPHPTKLRGLLHLWNSRGLWAIPRALKEDLYCFTDAVRYFAPSYVGEELTLYRGQSRIRHENGIYGIAWTSNYEIAEKFARLRDSSGIVLKIEASRDAIVVHLPDWISTPKTNSENKMEYEDEYLLDPKKIVDRVSVATG